MNNDEKQIGLPLTLRQSRAVEKTAPGAKRILSGMVADTLALAKPCKRTFHVLLCNGAEEIDEMWKHLIRGHLGEAYELSFTSRNTGSEISECAGKQPNDLIVAMVNNILVPSTDVNDRIRKAIDLLARLKGHYGIPVVALSGYEPKTFDLPGLLKKGGIETFLWVPFDIRDALKALDSCLKNPLWDKSDARRLPVIADTDLEGWYQTGEKYYCGKGVPQDFTEALKWHRKAAEHGHALAQNSVGVCYERGQGVPQDYAEAVKWYRKAAEQGEPYAQNNLGACYANGTGVSQDRAEAVNWYRRAAEQGNVLAKTNLGLWNGIGDGIPHYLEAVESCRKMADQGFAPAQYNLAVCYRDGNGVERDYAKAAKWFRKAAEQGHLDAQESLGACYANGRVAVDVASGMEDAIDAYQYVKLAEEKGCEGAARTVDVIIALLSHEEFREAERRYQELKSRRGSNTGKIADQPLQKRPLRITMLCSEPGAFKSLEIVIRYLIKDVTIFLFQDYGEVAWRELLRTDPDLLITANAMPVLSGKEIVRRLLDRKATYPIIVTSTSETEEWVQEYAIRGLNVTFLGMPWTVEDIRKLLETSLKISLDESPIK